MIRKNDVLIEYFYKSNSTTRLKIVTYAGHFEIESVYNNTRNVTQFEISRDGIKRFVIEPLSMYEHGEEITWQLSDEYKNKQVDHSLIENIGSAIESFIN